jgi:hypothetical protein
MQKPPQLLPSKLEDGQAPGIRYRIDGELVPVLHTWLDGTVPIYFEHHVVLWKDPAAQHRHSRDEGGVQADGGWHADLPDRSTRSGRDRLFP